jgi:hypothetical protein
MLNEKIVEGEGNGISRRKFLVGAGATVGAAALFGASHFSAANLAGVRVAQAAQLNSDMDILMFALTLEHLENAAYRAANASGLLQGNVARYFQSFGAHENEHVVVLTDTIQKLGGNPVREQSSYNLPTFRSQEELVMFFATVEEVGAGAYLGAAPLLQNKDLLTAAASIHNVEAQHASVLKAVMNDPVPSPAFGQPLSVAQVLDAVNPLLGTGGGTPGMPSTGLPVVGPIVVAAGLGAAAVGALIRLRSRENGEETKETETVEE